MGRTKTKLGLTITRHRTMAEDLRMLKRYIKSVKPFMEEGYPVYSRPFKSFLQVEKKIEDFERVMAEQFPRDVEDFVSPYQPDNDDD